MIEGLPRANLRSLVVDFSNLETISNAASEFLARESRLDVLWNNAGIAQAPSGSTTAQGYEAHMGTNCLGPHLFTQLLLPLLLQTARIAPTSSVHEQTATQPIGLVSFISRCSAVLTETLVTHARYRSIRQPRWLLQSTRSPSRSTAPTHRATTDPQTRTGPSSAKALSTRRRHPSTTTTLASVPTAI